MNKQASGYFVGSTISAENTRNQKGGLLTGLDGISDYDNHEGVFYQADPETKCLYIAFIHNTNRGQSQGGTRMRNYATMFDLLSDGLRLSKAMSEKCGVSNLWWGGGKAIICPVTQPVAELSKEQRKLIFSNYGKFIASLNGAYIAAEDMNTTPEDMQTILSMNRFVTCLPKAAGGSGNPSAFTAEGVFNAMLATVNFYEQKTSLEGCSVAIQGLGNVGGALARFVLDSGAKKVYVFDINQERLNQVKSWSDAVEIVASEAQLIQTTCDIFAPCAGGKILNTKVIEQLACKYVVGAANNQLDIPDQHARQLHERGIQYLPDFFINRMGIINCANEQYGWVKANLENEVEKVYHDTLELLEESRQKGISPHFGSMDRAEESMKSKHPIWPDQGKKIIRALIEG